MFLVRALKHEGQLAPIWADRQAPHGAGQWAQVQPRLPLGISVRAEPKQLGALRDHKAPIRKPAVVFTALAVGLAV